MFDYTLVITSCNRHDLLYTTLGSFIQYADVPPKVIIIVEDGLVEPPDWINSEERFRVLPKIWLPNRPKLGQVPSIDKAYSGVHTEYIFHCEDDWEFLATGFLEESYKILEKYPTVAQVSLWDRYIPAIEDSRFSCKISQPRYQEVWGGLTWNPGLRRLSDYKKIFGTFSRYLPEIPPNLDFAAGREAFFSVMMMDRGYVVASLDNFVKHTGTMTHAQ